MSSDINDVTAAIDILIRFIRGYDKVVAEDFSHLLNPITRGDIYCGITVLKRRLCQATGQEATDQEATGQEATDQEATDQEATDQEATEEATEEATDHEAIDQEAPDQEAPDQEAPDQEATDQEAPDQEATDHEAIDQEATTNEAEIQEILRDPESKLIFESFSDDETSATDFIASYGANPEHFWNKLPMFKDGDIVVQLFTLLKHHSGNSDLTQRLLEIKLYEQVELLARECKETPAGRGRTHRSKALKRALGHKASRADEYKVERGKKLSNFNFIDLFRISKPYWRKWRDIELEKVEMISRNLQPVKAEWAKNLSAVLSRVYQCIPSQTTGEGATRIQDSEVPIIPLPSLRTSEDPADSHADSPRSGDSETLGRELISSPAETIISNKRPASDLCPAAKRQRLGQVTPPSPGSDLQNDRIVHPSNDDSALCGGLDLSPLRDFSQTNPAVAHRALRCSLSDNSTVLDFSPRNQQRDAFGRVSTGPSLTHDATVIQDLFQLFQAQTRSREPSLAAVVDDSISPDQLDAIIASAENRVPWPTGMAGYNDEADLDAIIASAEHRVPWPTGIADYDADLDAIIASAEPRVPWPWPLPNQHLIAAT